MTEQNLGRPEREHQGPIWKHPYTIYIFLTVLLALFLGFMGWLAILNNWIPDRGVHS